MFLRVLLRRWVSYSTALLPFVTTVVLGMFCDAIGHWSDAVACENSKGTRGGFRVRCIQLCDVMAGVFRVHCVQRCAASEGCAGSAGHHPIQSNASLCGGAGRGLSAENGGMSLRESCQVTCAILSLCFKSPVYVPACLPASIHAHLPPCLFVYQSLSICHSTNHCPFVCFPISVHLSVYQSLSVLSVFQSLSICLSSSLFIRQSTSHLSVC